MVKAIINGLMAEDTLASGKMVNNMELAYIIQKKEQLEKGFGIKVKGLGGLELVKKVNKGQIY